MEAAMAEESSALDLIAKVKEAPPKDSTADGAEKDEENGPHTPPQKTAAGARMTEDEQRKRRRRRTR